MEGAHRLVETLDIGKIKDAVIHNLKGLDRLKLPDEAIKFDVKAILSRIKKQRGSNRIYKGRWADFPSRETPMAERHERIKDLFNDIGEYAKKIKNPQKHVLPSRRWSARCTTCDKVAPCSEHTSQPCLALTNDGNAERIEWKNILTVVEYEFGPVIASKNAAIKRLAQSAQSIFEHQPDRSYVICAAMCNSDMAIVVFNRGGAYTSDWFNIHTSTIRFIRNLVGLMSAERVYLGFGPDMVYTEVDAPSAKTVIVNEKEYVIEELLSRDDNVRGCAPSWWRISRDGKEFMLKDTWFRPDSFGESNEVETMFIIQNTEGVPKFIDYGLCEDVSGVGHYNTRGDIEDLEAEKTLTKGQREKFRNWDVLRRLRIVTAPYEAPIRDFKSRRELLYALITIVDTMEKLYEKDILHRDISRYNIALSDKTNEFGERGGLLFNYAYAVYPANRHCKSLPGPPRFVARDYLCPRKKYPWRHRYYYDLESLFYVICYIFTTSAGPLSVFREDLNDILEKSIVGKWSGWGHEGLELQDALDCMGSLKSSHCEDEKLFETVIDEFTEYFKEDALKKCMRDLRELVFAEGVNRKLQWSELEKLVGEDGSFDVKYVHVDDRLPSKYFQAFKRILQEAYDTLEETKSMTRQTRRDKNPCDGQEQMPESTIAGSQESRNEPDTEASLTDADAQMGNSGPVFELTNPSPSAPVTSNDSNKKRKRSSDTQGESESPPPKRAASDKENITDKDISNLKLNVSGVGKPPLSLNGRLERGEILSQDPERPLSSSKVMNGDEEGAE